MNSIPILKIRENNLSKKSAQAEDHKIFFGLPAGVYLIVGLAGWLMAFSFKGKFAKRISPMLKKTLNKFTKRHPTSVFKK